MLAHSIKSAIFITDWIINMLYKLTDQNIASGHLTDKDLSSGLGYHVTTFPLESFPYSEKLLRDELLTREEIEIRSDAIYYALEERGLVNHGNNSSFFTYEDAAAVACNSFSTVRSSNVKLNFSGPPVWGRHFALISANGFIDAHNHEEIWIHNNDDDLGTTIENVFPGILDEEIPVTRCTFQKAAFMLLDREISSRNYWARFLRLAPELLEVFPADNSHLLREALHEKRHLHQIGIKSSSHAANYYAELDADMAAIASLQIVGIGKDTITCTKHARYMDMLFAPPLYWFAPAMEDLHHGRYPENFFRTHSAVTEIRVRLGASLSEQPLADLSSQALQYAIGVCNQEISNGFLSTPISVAIHDMHNVFLHRTWDVAGKNPAPIFTELRKLLEQNVFTDPFAERIAGSIVAAARHFNPDLITADSGPSRQRLQERLRAGTNPTCG